MSENDNSPQQEIIDIQESQIDSISGFPNEAQQIVNRDIEVVNQLTKEIAIIESQLISAMDRVFAIKNKLLSTLENEDEPNSSKEEAPPRGINRIFRKIRTVVLGINKKANALAPDTPMKAVEDLERQLEQSLATCQYFIDQSFSSADSRTVGHSSDARVSLEEALSRVQNEIGRFPNRADKMKRRLTEIVDYVARTQIESAISVNVRTSRTLLQTSSAILKQDKGGSEYAIYSGIDHKTIWTPTELNEKYSAATLVLSSFQDLIRKTCETLSLPTQTYDLSREIHSFTPVTHEDYQRLHKVSTDLANDSSFLFHSAVIPNVRKEIIGTGRLRSRKAQIRDKGRANFFIKDSQLQAGSNDLKTDDEEEDQICFSQSQEPSAYSRGTGAGGTGFGIFSVAVPARLIYRSAGFFNCDGVHVFNLPDPTQGYEVAFNQVGATIVCDEPCRKNLEAEFGAMEIDELLKSTGVPVVKSVKDLEISIPKEEMIRKARIVPTGILMDKPGTKRSGMVYKLNCL